MKRYLAPLLILAILLLVGSSLWLRSGSVPAAVVDSQAESSTAQTPSDGSEDSSVPDEAFPETPTNPDDSDKISPSDSSNSSETEAPPAGTVSPENTPSAPVSNNSKPSQASAPTKSQPTSTKKPATPPAQTQPSSPESQATTEPQPKAPAEDPAAMAEALLAEINQERASAGVPPLTLDSALSSVAQLRAQECTIKFGHTRPNGSAYSSAVTDAGLSYQHLGENLASGQTSAQDVMQSWDSSDGHHDNVVSEDFTNVGIGLAPNTNGKYSGYAWAVVFKG